MGKAAQFVFGQFLVCKDLLAAHEGRESLISGPTFDYVTLDGDTVRTITLFEAKECGLNDFIGSGL